MSVYLIVFSLFPAVWILRNHNLSPNASKGSERAISIMSHGAYPGFIYKDPKFKYFPYREDPMQPAFSSSLENFISIFTERFKQRPVRYLAWYFFEKPFYLWSWNMLQGQGDVYVYPVIKSLYQTSKIANLPRILMKCFHPIILILSFIGIPIVINESYLKKNEILPYQTPFIIFIVLIYYTLLYTVFAPWPRYSIPLRPELYLCALWSLKISIEHLMKRRREKYARSK